VRYPTSVKLQYAGATGGPAELRYSVSPVDARQARFQGRVVYRPEIDLSLYQCRAVIDYLVLRLDVGRPSQFRHVKEAFDLAGGTNCYVRAVEPDPGGVSRQFDVTIQEPSLAALRITLRNMNDKFPTLSDEVEVVAAEFSVDFYSKAGSVHERLGLAAVIGRHFFPVEHLPAHEQEGIRWVYSRVVGGRHRTLHGLRSNWAARRDRVRFPFGDRAGYVDGTLYLGERRSPQMWRVMHKILDRQSPEDGRREELESEAQRVRIEVRLGPEPLRTLGVMCLDDLERLSFTRLQGSFFQFKLPTFLDPGLALPIQRRLEGYRVERFLGLGMVGLAQLDREAEDRRRNVRNDAKVRLHAIGRKLAPARRTGIGKQANYMAYLELNDMVSAAFEELGRRERRAAG
jgi:hypothetical protein